MLNDPNLRKRGPLPVETGIAQALVANQGSGAAALLTGLQPTPPELINPYGLEVQSNVAQSIANATFVPLQFPVQYYPVAPSPFWNAATNTFTIPVSGRYVVSARSSLVIGVAGSVVTYYISLWANGVNIFNGNGELYTQPAGGLAVTLSSILVVDHQYKSGDQLQVQAWHNYGSAQSSSGSTLNDWWTAHLISTLQ